MAAATFLPSQWEFSHCCHLYKAAIKCLTHIRCGKTGNKKHATCHVTMLQNELNNNVVRFTTYIKPVLQQIRLLTGLNAGGKTRNITLQLVLQQCCMASCMFFVARFSAPLVWLYFKSQYDEGKYSLRWKVTIDCEPVVLLPLHVCFISKWYFC